MHIHLWDVLLRKISGLKDCNIIHIAYKWTNLHSYPQFLRVTICDTISLVKKWHINKWCWEIWEAQLVFLYREDIWPVFFSPMIDIWYISLRIPQVILCLLMVPHLWAKLPLNCTQIWRFPSAFLLSYLMRGGIEF